jgi:hypothetical protein
MTSCFFDFFLFYKPLGQIPATVNDFDLFPDFSTFCPAKKLSKKAAPSNAGGGFSAGQRALMFWLEFRSLRGNFESM